MSIDVKGNVLSYYKPLQDDPHDRARSWEHCYSYFQQQPFAGEGGIDLGCLHLAFYLASWGMVRRSSKLLQKDYRVHLPVVRELLSPRYASLWRLELDALHAGSPEVDLVFELVEALPVSRAETVPPHSTSNP